MFVAQLAVFFSFVYYNHEAIQPVAERHAMSKPADIFGQPDCDLRAVLAVSALLVSFRSLQVHCQASYLRIGTHHCLGCSLWRRT